MARLLRPIVLLSRHVTTRCTHHTSKLFCQQSGAPSRVLLPSPASSSIYSGPTASMTMDTLGKVKKGIKRKSKAVKERLVRERHAQETPSLPKEARQKPSQASGGVPSPSPSYLAQSLPDPVTLTSPRRILVILDLNGTLLCRPSRRHRPSHIIIRPYACDFLQYCLRNFHVAVWSSARPENVLAMLSRLLKPHERSQCVAIWSRDKLGLSKDDYNAKVQVYKRLSVFWDDEQVRSSHPEAGGEAPPPAEAHQAHQQQARWDQSNTVLVDDSAEKGRSEPYNILALPEFAGLESETPHVLPQVHDYLNTLSYQADISRYMRRTPFALNPEYRLPPSSN